MLPRAESVNELYWLINLFARGWSSLELLQWRLDYHKLLYIFRENVRILMRHRVQQFIFFKLVDGFVVKGVVWNSEYIDVATIRAHYTDTVATHVELQTTDFVTPAKRLLNLVGAIGLSAVVPYVHNLTVTAWLQKSNHCLLFELLCDCWINGWVHAWDNIEEVLTVPWVDVDFSLQAEQGVTSTWQYFNTVDLFSKMSYVRPTSIPLCLCFQRAWCAEKKLRARLICLWLCHLVQDAYEDGLIWLTRQCGYIILCLVLESDAFEPLCFVFIIFVDFNVSHSPRIVVVPVEATLAFEIFKAILLCTDGRLRRRCPIYLLKHLERSRIELSEATHCPNDCKLTL